MSKNPDHDIRRTVIREWMALPKAQRQSKDQAAAFVGKASERHALKTPGDATTRMASWLAPRVGRN